VDDEHLPFGCRGDARDRVPDHLECLVLRVDQIELRIPVEHSGHPLDQRRRGDDPAFFEQEEHVMPGAMSDVPLDEP